MKRRCAVGWLLVVTMLAWPAALRAMESAVGVSNVSLEGEIEGENIVFTLKFDVESRTQETALPLVVGDTAYLDGTFPRGAEIARDGDRYLLKLPRSRRWFRGGPDPVTFRFAARPVADGDWRQTSFAIPVSTIRRIAVLCDRNDLDVQFPGALNVERSRLRPEGDDAAEGRTQVTGYLGVAERFEVRWKPEMRKLDAELVATCEAQTVATASIGALRLDTLFTYRVIQGVLSELSFALPDVNITRVLGDHIQDWRIDAERQRLHVTLSRPQTALYRLQVESEMALPVFPCRFTLPVLTPEAVLRTSGFLMIGTDSAIRFQVRRAAGLTQVDAAAFPKTESSEPDAARPRARPTRSVYAYQYANMPYALEISADDIVTDFTADSRLSLTLSERILSLRASVELDVKDAPLRDVRIETGTETDWTLTTATGRDVAIADTDMREKDGVRFIHIPFRKAVLGTTLIEIRMERALPPGATSFGTPTFSVRDARSDRGYVVMAAETGLRLKADSVVGLREIHTGSAPMRVPNAQQAFRFREPGWTATLSVERAEPAIHSEIFHLVSLSKGVMYSSAAITYHVGGAPLQEFNVRVPETIARVDFVGADIEGWTRDKDICTVRLQSRIMGDYTLLVSYDRPFPPDRADVELAAIETVGTESEMGYVALASSASISFRESQPLPPSMFRIDRDEIPAEYAALVMDPIIGAYKYTHAPHRAVVQIERFPTEPPLGQIADYVELSTVMSKDGESVTTVNIYIKNATRQHLIVRLPPEASLWSIQTVDEQGRKEHALSQQDRGALLIPVRRLRDPNTALQVELVYAQAHGSLGFWRSGVSRATVAGPVMPETHTAFARWRIAVPDGFSISGVSGAMTPSRTETVTGLADTVAKAWGLVRAVFDPYMDFGDVLRDGWGGGQTAELTRAVDLADNAHPEIKMQIVPSWMGPRSSARGLLVGCLLGAAILIRGPRRRARAAWLALGWTLTLLGLSQAALGRTVLAVLILLVAIAVFLAKGGPRALGRAGRRLFQRLRVKRRTDAHLPAPADPDTDPDSEHADDLQPFDPPVMPDAQPDASRNGAARTGLLVPTVLAGLTFLQVFAAAAATPVASTPVMDSVHLAIETPESGSGHEASAEIALTLNFRAAEALSFIAVPGVSVLKRYDIDERNVKVAIHPGGYLVQALRPGTYTVTLVYQTPIRERDGQRALTLYLPPNIRNRATLTLPETGLDIRSPEAVLFASEEKDGRTVAEAVFGPAQAVMFHWRPRARRTQLEPVVFFSEVDVLAVLRPGVADVHHRIHCRIAQGEIRDMKARIPPGMTVTAVDAPRVATWSFDPDTRLLEAILDRPVSGELDLRVRTQIACDGLPYNASAGVLETLGAARQRGTLAVAAPDSVQVHVESFDGLTPMNIEDVSSLTLALALGKPTPGAETPVLRRAFRYHRAAEAVARVHAERVMPEIRVEESGALTLAEERIALATRLRLSIAKAGVFSTDLLIPAEFEVETLTGRDVSHWDDRGVATHPAEDESGEAEDAEHVPAWNRVAVHFHRPILGDTDVNLVIARTERGIETAFQAPRVVVDGARSHRGRLTIAGERGVRLMVAHQTGVDMKKASDIGIRQAGVLVFDIHRPDWRIELSAQTLEPVVKPGILHHVDLAEGMMQYQVYLRYAIENAGVKTFLLQSPAPDASLSVTGAGIARVHPVDPERGLWQVDLHNRVETRYAMRVAFQIPYDRAARRVTIRPLRTLETEAPRGFVAVTGSGRIQVAALEESPALRPIDPRTIPADFGAGDLSAAVKCYETPDPDYALALSVVRHDSADVLPAGIDRVRIVSALSADGTMLSRVRMAMTPGPLRLLKTALPDGSDPLWLALVNGKEVSVSRDGALFCIPLDTDEDARSLQVDFIYASASRSPGWRARRHFEAPLFEGLPLRDIEWIVFAPAHRTYYGFGGNMDVLDPGVGTARAFDVKSYLAHNRVQREATLQEAGRLLDQGAQLMQSGRQREAREALRSALTYSQGEPDLNEDARVQYRHLQMQQAKMGLFERRGSLRAARNIVEEQTLAPTPGFKDGEYSPEYIARVEQTLSARDRSALDIVANRIVARQDAAQETVSAIRLAMPEHGRRLVFQRGLHIDPDVPLTLSFKVGRGRFARALAEIWPAFILFAGLAVVMGKKR